MLTMNIAPTRPVGRLFALRSLPPKMPTARISTRYATNHRSASRGLAKARAPSGAKNAQRTTTLEGTKPAQHDHEGERESEHEAELSEAEDIVSARHGQHDDGQEGEDRVGEWYRPSERFPEYDVREPPEDGENADEQRQPDKEPALQSLMLGISWGGTDGSEAREQSGHCVGWMLPLGRRIRPRASRPEMTDPSASAARTTTNSLDVD